MPDYEIHAGGKTVTITSDHPPTAAEVQAVFKHAGLPDPTLQGRAPWTQAHPYLAQSAHLALDTLPSLGGIAGGMLAAPETLGTGALAGAALGVGAGRGLRDLIAQYTGLEAPTSPLEKAATIGTDTALAAVTPGATEAALHPISALEEGAHLLPARLRAMLPMLQQGAKAEPILARPSWQIGAEVPPDPVEVDRYLPNSGGLPPVQSPAPSRAPVPYGIPGPTAPAPTGAPPTLVKGTGAPTLSDALTQALTEAREAPAAPAGTTAPARTITVAGKPSVTPAEQDEITRLARQYGKPQQGPSVKGSGGGFSGTGPKMPPKAIPTAAGGADSLSTLLDAIHGADSPSVGNGTYTGPGASVPNLAEDLTRLRRTYGADRLGRALSPATPEVAVGQIVKQTGAPSAMPDLAQKVLLDHLKDPTQITNGPRFLRALSQLLREYERNQGPAQSPTARAVADLLAKHGFKIP